MPGNWSIKAEWESLETGAVEERACFAAVGIYAHGYCLTEGVDALVNRLREAPLLSAYDLAEWLAWNWWRLRWEPRSKAADWDFAHSLSSIGGGYVWPNLTVFSDGERTALLAKPTDPGPAAPFRYIADRAAVIAASEFEAVLDGFFEQVVGRLEQAGIQNSNFTAIWASLGEERKDPRLARARKLEALLGKEPDESDPDTLLRMIADSKKFGTTAIDELAAEYGHTGALIDTDTIVELAQTSGYASSAKDATSYRFKTETKRGQTPAWRTGAEAARGLRIELGNRSEPIQDRTLAEIIGVDAAVLGEGTPSVPFSFALDTTRTNGRVALRPKWIAGRRFELARLLGDRVCGQQNGKLFPATHAYTYRQKMQRSFAAEFLSPFEAIDGMLAGDYSLERQYEVADHYRVSPMTVRTLLVNHERIDRDDLLAAAQY